MHERQWYRLLSQICQGVYAVKGHKGVKVKFLPEYRAYSFVSGEGTYLSMGPGWAYDANFLYNALIDTYNFYYRPKRGDCILDLGAGLGEETVVYAKLVGNEGKVVAVEANPTTFGGLQYLCKENNFSWVTPLNVAIYDDEGMVAIEDDPMNYLTNTISHQGARQVRAITMDGLVQQQGLTQIDFLKSNIEGAEQYLTSGMKGAIDKVRHACISCHDFREIFHGHGRFYVTKRIVTEFLQDHGFAINTRHTGNRVIDDYVYGTNKRLV